MKLYEEIKNEVKTVIEAEEMTKAWKAETRNRMRDVNTMIAVAEKVNKEKYDRKTLIDSIRQEIADEATMQGDSLPSYSEADVISEKAAVTE